MPNNQEIFALRKSDQELFEMVGDDAIDDCHRLMALELAYLRNIAYELAARENLSLEQAKITIQSEFFKCFEDARGKDGGACAEGCEHHHGS